MTSLCKICKINPRMFSLKCRDLHLKTKNTNTPERYDQVLKKVKGKLTISIHNILKTFRKNGYQCSEKNSSLKDLQVSDIVLFCNVKLLKLSE